MVVPVGQHTQSNKVFFLSFNLLGGVRTAFFLDFQGWLSLADCFFDLDFNWHAMAIPAGYVTGIIAGQATAFHDDVFQDFVDRMANVNVTIGIGWAVVQHKFWLACLGLANRLVQVFLAPLFNPVRFPLRQVAAHWEGRVWQVQCVLVIHVGLTACI
jgi:hypothetical protein